MAESIQASQQSVSLTNELPKTEQIDQSHDEDDDQHHHRSKFEEILFKMKLKFFAQRLISQTSSRMFKSLQPAQYRIIGDKAWDEDTESKNKKIRGGISGFLINKASSLRRTISEATEDVHGRNGFSSFIILQYIIQFLRIIDRKVIVFDPSSFFKVSWDIISIILLSSYFFLIPFFITFVSLKKEVLFQLIIYSVPIFVISDFLVKANTGCYQKGKLIMQRDACFRQVFRKHWKIDLLIFICFMVYLRLQSKDDHSRMIDLLLITLIGKVMPFLSTLNKLEEFSFFSKRSKNVIALFKLIYTIILIAHILSCMWVAVAESETQQGSETWLKNKQFYEMQWHEIYIDSYYFTTVTMVTVGFGDIVPLTEFEKIVCIIFMIFSCGVFAYSMNTIGSILESFNEHQQRIQHNMSIINAYMRRKSIGKQTQSAIREYLDYYWKEQSERDQEQEDKIIGLLSDNLRENLQMESKGVALKKSAVFRDNFSEETRLRIVPLIKEYRFTPEQIISFQEEEDDCSIYFIEKGSVYILFETEIHNKQIHVATLGVGQSFGEISFFTGQPRTATIRSKEFTTLLMVKRIDFLELIKHSEQDYEQFCTIKDYLSLYNDFSLINVRCISCGSLNHQLLACPYLHFIPNDAKLRGKFLRQINQERKLFSRKKEKSHHAYASNALISLNAFEYKFNHQQSLSINNDGQRDLTSNEEDFHNQLKEVESRYAREISAENNQSLKKKNEQSPLSPPSRFYQHQDDCIVDSNILSSLQEEFSFKGPHSDMSNNFLMDEQKMYKTIPNEKTRKKRAASASRDEDSVSPLICSKLIKQGTLADKTYGEFRRHNGENLMHYFHKQDTEDVFLKQQSSSLSNEKSFQIAQNRQIFGSTQNCNLEGSLNIRFKLISLLKQMHDLLSDSTGYMISSSMSPELQIQQLGDYNGKENNFRRTGDSKIIQANQEGIYQPMVKSAMTAISKANFTREQKNNLLNSNGWNMSDNQRAKKKKNETTYGEYTVINNNIHTHTYTNNRKSAQQSQNAMNLSFYETEIFDVMKDFVYYFPLNNLSHYLSVFQMTTDQQKKKLIRHHADNLATFKLNQTTAVNNKKLKRQNLIQLPIQQILKLDHILKINQSPKTESQNGSIFSKQVVGQLKKSPSNINNLNSPQMEYSKKVDCPSLRRISSFSGYCSSLQLPQQQNPGDSILKGQGETPAQKHTTQVDRFFNPPNKVSKSMYFRESAQAQGQNLLKSEDLEGSSSSQTIPITINQSFFNQSAYQNDENENVLSEHTQQHFSPSIRIQCPSMPLDSEDIEVKSYFPSQVNSIQSAEYKIAIKSSQLL